MMQNLGYLWFDIYLLKVRGPLFGLSPLQQYIVEHHNRDEKSENNNPLITYLYFLTYENEVWERKHVHELMLANNATKEEVDKYPLDNGRTAAQAKDIYEESRKALLYNKNSIENTRIKMMLHMVSLVFIITLMLSASAVSTGKLMDLWGNSFGPYAYLAQAFFYVSAAAAQWMIYRKTVPEVLKKLLYIGKEGWHFKRKRDLKINGDKLVDKGMEEEQPDYSKTKLSFFVFCSALLALSLGMIVLDTSAATAADGNVFKSMEGINALAQMFGGVSSFGWFLCIASIFCNFALFISASLNYLFKQADDKKKGIKAKKLTGVAFAALVVLVVLNGYGLAATVMSQASSTLNFFWKQLTLKDGMPEGNELGMILMPIFTIVAGICGRGLFNIKAMENLRSLIGELWSGRADMWVALKKDYDEYKWTYRLGITCVATVALVFGLSYVGETPIDGLNPITKASSILPVVGTLGAAIAVFCFFKMGRNKIDWDNRPNGSESNHGSLKATPPNSNATQYKFTLQHNSERRSGQQLLMIFGNSVGAGALAASSVNIFLLYGSKHCEELKITLTVLAMIGGGLMSMGSAMNRVNADEEAHKRVSFSTHNN